MSGMDLSMESLQNKKKTNRIKETSHSLISIARRVNRYILPHPILQSSRIGAVHIFHQKERYTPLKLFFFFIKIFYKERKKS